MLRLHFWIKSYTKAIDSITITYWILKRIPSRLKPFVNTRIFPLATHQIVSLAAVFSVVTRGGALRDDTKNGCEGDYTTEVKKGFVKGIFLRLLRTNSQIQHLRKKILKILNHDSLLDATQII